MGSTGTPFGDKVCSGQWEQSGLSGERAAGRPGVRVALCAVLSHQRVAYPLGICSLTLDMFYLVSMSSKGINQTRQMLSVPETLTQNTRTEKRI